MTKWVRRAAGPARYVLMVSGALGLLSFGTGCGALGAMANPKLVPYLNENADLVVVVRREDAAEATAKQIDRLLTGTPANNDSAWFASTGPKPEDSAGDVKAVMVNPLYAKAKLHVVAAEAWAPILGDIQSKDGKSPSLLAMVSTDLADAYSAIGAKQKEIADVNTQIQAEKDAKDAKGASDADKAAHDKTIDELNGKLSKLKDEVDPLKKKFLETAKAAAAKAPDDVRKAVGPTLVNLRQAADDASFAAGAAGIRWPLAMKGIKDAVTEVVPIIVADIIEEQTGTRPNLANLKPDIKLDGTDVKVTIAGLSPSDVGKIKVEDVTTETLKRTKDWVVHAVTLLAAVANTGDEVSFEKDTLDALIDGFVSAGWAKSTPATIPPETDPKVASAQAKVRPHLAPGATAPATATAQDTSQQAAPASTAQTAPAANTAPAAGKKPGKGGKGK